MIIVWFEFVKLITKLKVGFDRDIYLLTGSMFIRRIVMGFLQVVRAIYFAILGFSAVEIGLLLSIGTLISAINNVVFGYLCDRYGRKPFLVLGTFMASARTAIFAVSTDFWFLAVAQGLGAMGEGVGAGQPVVSGYITDKVEVVHRSNVYSTIAITSSLAATLGLMLGGLPQYIEGFGYEVIPAHQVLWWACTILNLVSLFFLFSIKEGISKPGNSESQVRRAKTRDWGPIIKFSIVRSTSGFGWSMVDSLMTLYFYYRFSIGTDVLGPIFALARFISTFTYFFVPIAVYRLGAINTIIMSRVVSAVLSAGFAFTSWYPLALVIMVINRLVVLFTMPIRQTFASELVDPSKTATVIGLSNSARMGVQTIAPSLAGYMFENLSMQLPFLTGAGFMLLNGVLYWAFFREKPEKMYA
jgi:MFS family permease